MADWTALADTLFEIGKPIRSVDITALKNNVTALAEGAAGAPRVQTAALNDSAVTAAKIAAGNVVYGKLAASSVPNAAIRVALQQSFLSITGTSYGTITYTGGVWTLGVGFGADASMSVPTGGTYLTPVGSVSYVSAVGCWNGGSIGNFYIQAYYIVGSPPYDLGDGEIPLFVFGLVDNSSGEIVGVDVATDPPWMYNGPTDCRAHFYGADGKPYRIERDLTVARTIEDPVERADALAEAPKRVVEIDMAMKMRDRNVVPHPWLHNDLAGRTVVLLDPVGRSVERLLRLREEGEDIAALLRARKIRIANTPLARATPNGVIAVGLARG